MISILSLCFASLLAPKAAAKGKHKWKKWLSKEEVARTLDYYKERYKQ